MYDSIVDIVIIRYQLKTFVIINIIYIIFMTIL